MDAKKLIESLTVTLDQAVTSAASQRVRNACATAAAECGTSLSESAEFKLAMTAQEEKVRQRIFNAVHDECLSLIKSVVFNNKDA